MYGDMHLLEFQSLAQLTDHSSDPGDMSDMVVGMGCEGGGVEKATGVGQQFVDERTQLVHTRTCTVNQNRP